MNCKGETDEDGVEYHAKLENEDRSQLSRVGFWDDTRIALPRGKYILVIDVLPGMSQVVITRGVGWSMLHANICFLLALPSDHSLGLVMAGGVVMVVSVAEPGVAHGHKLQDEHDKDGHESDPLGPVVVGDGPSETFICECLGSWS